MNSYARHSLIFPRIRFFAVLIAITALAPSAGAESVSQTVDVVATIEPELSLTVAPQTGREIDFGTLYSSPTEPRLSDPIRVDVHVFSNLGRPYHVTHQLTRPLTNEAGMSLSPEALRASVNSPADVMDHLGRQPRTLFVSDARGRSTDQTVSYHLDIPPGQASGRYRGTLVLTVTAL
ncbi:MAG: hypothetical protein HY737_08045 [Candidatus Omnitrophica bacterium]|nr:hypothetical protein [Candidatus Omnitrophota bacterium]